MIMKKSIEIYKELDSIQNEVVGLQKRVNEICRDLLHDENFIVAAGFKVALMTAMCEMNESMAKIKI